MKRNVKNLSHSGFSLVEALVGLSIAAGIGLVLMQQQESSSKMQAKNNANQIVESAANVVQSAISNRAVCSLSLKDKVVGQQVPALVDAVVDPSDYSSFIATGNPNHVTVGQELPGGVIVEDMKIVTELGKDYLSVTFNLNPKGTKKMFGTTVVGKKFQLQGVKSGAAYQSCHSELSNLVATACTTMPGGVWDAGTQKCDLGLVVKKAELVPVFTHPASGMMTFTQPYIEASKVTCQKNHKQCSRTSMDCTVNCPAGQGYMSEREYDRCQAKVMGVCTDEACMKEVTCGTPVPAIGFIVKP